MEAILSRLGFSNAPVLGKGDYGTVFRISASHALKIIKRNPKIKLVKWHAMLANEHTVQVKLAALGIAPHVTPLEFEGDYAYFGMDLIQATVRQAFNDQCNRPGSPKCAEVPVAMQRAIIGVLETAIEHGIIHEDNHLDNIAIGMDGRIKLIDFGFAESCAVAEVCAKRQILLASLYQLIEHMTFKVFVDTEFYNVIYAIRDGSYKFGAHMKHAHDVVFHNPTYPSPEVTPVGSPASSPRVAQRSRTASASPVTRSASPTLTGHVAKRQRLKYDTAR